MNEAIRAKIKQRRRQMLVHSYIYYELNKNIVSDATWSRWAKELEKLQLDYPEESKSVEYYEMFQNWDGSSGAFLKFGENIKTVANILITQFEKNSQNTQLNVHKPKVYKKKQTASRSLF